MHNQLAEAFNHLNSSFETIIREKIGVQDLKIPIIYLLEQSKNGSPFKYLYTSYSRKDLAFKLNENFKYP